MARAKYEQAMTAHEYHLKHGTTASTPKPTASRISKKKHVREPPRTWLGGHRLLTTRKEETEAPFGFTWMTGQAEVADVGSGELGGIGEGTVVGRDGMQVEMREIAGRMEEVWRGRMRGGGRGNRRAQGRPSEAAERGGCGEGMVVDDDDEETGEGEEGEVPTEE